MMTKPSDEHLQGLAKLEIKLGTYDEALGSMARELLEWRKYNVEPADIWAKWVNAYGEQTSKVEDLKVLLAVAEKVVDVMRHAIALEYFSEGGSTDAWAKEALEAYDKVMNETNTPENV